MCAILLGRRRRSGATVYRTRIGSNREPVQRANSQRRRWKLCALLSLSLFGVGDVCVICRQKAQQTAHSARRCFLPTMACAFARGRERESKMRVQIRLPIAILLWERVSFCSTSLVPIRTVPGNFLLRVLLSVGQVQLLPFWLTILRISSLGYCTSSSRRQKVLAILYQSCASWWYNHRARARAC